MSIDLILKPSCGGCGSTVELYGSMCKHLTLCVNCGKTMAENRAKCYECGTPITRLIREYNVRACPSGDRNYFIARFTSGLPNFNKKNENKWTLQKEGLQGRQVSDTLREKYKTRPWLLEDETGQFQYQGVVEGSPSATYYLLMLQGKEFVAIPSGSWYNFNKVAQYKQLTLEEAEEKMKNRRKTADGYQRWMMKAANNGAAAFGEVEKPDDRETAAGGGRGRKKSTGGDDDEANVSDRGEEDEDEEAARKNRLGLNKKGGDDDEEGPRGGDLDFDDDDIEKGDDWEHEEIFTDDDEAMLVFWEFSWKMMPEVFIKKLKFTALHLLSVSALEQALMVIALNICLQQLPAKKAYHQKENNDDDEDEGEEEEGGLSKSGKELKKLLGRSNGLNDSDAEDDDDDDDTEEDISPVFAPKKEAPKEEPVDNSSPLKSTTAGASRGTPSTSKSSKGKRKSNGDESKTPNTAPPKKVKTENDVKSVKEEPASSTKSSVPSKGGAPPQASSKSAPAPTGPVTEDEIRAVLMQKTPVTTQDLVAKFKSRLKLKEDKDAFAAILRRISKIQKTNGANYVVLRER
ncbi:transcription initiation factor iif subunit alpha [Phtheirospermum japonicum]|uniref:Transcription initiation factor IIF subunit alpha n=1 Tax=Phtheirospermum japonicum TaxID=374723 RepID=A0A830BLK2_9LAMI|nr:transcription initiation factor iif subunit alpha [Phtheirospermum japonicum]